ncbi:MAG: MFS transporter [Proteobacteria bacterium]|nr:MFS transporter [Pseudomonadota bacterium]
MSANLDRATKFAYGLGAIAFGARDTGFNVFILLFYNQVLGLDASLTGLALMLSLVADAVFDPLIGTISDGWRSRLGRRHPFFFAAAVPVAVAHVFLWMPPASLSGAGLFFYLLGFSILVRMLASLFEVPYAALAAELTSDYDDRTALMSWLFAIGWWGGLALSVFAYAVLFRPDPGDPTGLLNRHGFALFGITGSLVLLAGILIPAFATRHLVPSLPQAEPRTLAQALRDFAIVLRQPSVASLLLSVVLLSASQGFGTALYNYIQVFFWGLTSPQISILALTPFVSAGLAMAFSGRLTAGRDKRDVAVALVAVAIVGQPLPLLLRVAGLFPGNDSPWLLPILAVHSAFETLVWVLFSIVSSSMVADLVEETRRFTLRRTEGALFALRIFAQKAVSGLGILLSGLLLRAVAFPENAAPGHVPPATLDRLVLAYAPIFVGLGLASAFALRGYHVTRARHALNLRAMPAGD